MTDVQRGLAHTVISVLFIGIIIFATFWVMQPFLAALVWATMIVVTTWPLLLGLQRLLWNKRPLAVTVLTLTLMLVLIVPLSAAVVTIAQRSDQIAGWIGTLTTLQLPPAPEWLERIPLVGHKAIAGWNQLAALGAGGLATYLAPYSKTITAWFLAKAGTVGTLLGQFLLTVIIAAILYSNGEAAANGMIRFGRRLAADRGEHIIRLAGQSIRAVALGVGVTAIVQTVFSGIGLAIAGVPFASLLTAIILMLCIAQLGPILVLLPSVAWLFYSDQPGWGTFLLVWSLVAGTMDNFLRPVLIKRGADLPLLLIFAGVIGGLLSIGLIGLFIGPVILAVSYTLLGEWIAQVDQPAGDG
jgi:predicted PurR-regulated permease PerM